MAYFDRLMRTYLKRKTMRAQSKLLSCQLL